MGRSKNYRGAAHTRPMEAKSVLADTYIPNNKRAINLVPVRERWMCDTSWIDNHGNDIDYNSRDMEKVIVSLAKSFIPAVQCTCSKDKLQPPPHAEGLFLPTLPHHVAPNFQFALHYNAMFQAAQQKLLPGIVDLDETTSTMEYYSMFEQALRLDYEEHLRLYELYSLYDFPLELLDECPHPATPGPDGKKFLLTPTHRKARLVVDGIADARPTLQIGDILLLRPITANGPLSLEIESRILGVIRGRKNADGAEGKDQVILTWGLNHEQSAFLGPVHPSNQQNSHHHDQVNVLFNVRFVPSPIPLERCLTALDWLKHVSRKHPQALNDVLFPVKAPNVKPLTGKQNSRLKQDDSDINKPLNELQASFVRMVGARTRDPEYDKVRPPMILTGPAGTGKTKTLMVTIADVLGLMPSGDGNDLDKTKNRVLVCAPSHAAADVITHRLKTFLNQVVIFRMYDKSRPINTVPATIIPFTCQNPVSGDFTLPNASAWSSFRVVVCTCMDAHILFRAKITNEAIAKRRKCFRQFLLSDSNNLGFSFFNFNELPDNSSDPYFSHLFIDEAAQASEPEILIPMSCVIDPYPGAKKAEVALIGDPRQLSPLIFSETAHNYGLSRSFMERLLKRPVQCLGGGEEHMLGPVACSDSLFDDRASSLTDLIRYYANVDGQELLTVFLCENYRGHSSFLMMPSSLFYFDRLRCKKDLGSHELKRWCSRLRAIEACSYPVKHPYSLQEANLDTRDAAISIGSFFEVHKQEWPISFVGVIGEDKSVALDNFTGTDSWQNATEAKIVLGIVTNLVKHGVAASRIGVMAPFRGQVVLIRQYLRSKNLFDVNVGTIENYQGVEQDAIIFSLTRSNVEFVPHDIKRRMGVLGEVQQKQMNVALTRAENLFIMTGNPEVMWKDRLWRQWLMFCFRNGLWYGRGLTPEDMQMMSSRSRNIISSPQEDSFRDGMSTIVSTLEKVERLN